MKKHLLKRILVMMLAVAIIAPTIATSIALDVRAEEEEFYEYDGDYPDYPDDPQSDVPDYPDEPDYPDTPDYPEDPGTPVVEPEEPAAPPMITPEVEIYVSPKKASFGTVAQGEVAYTSVSVTVGGTVGVTISWIEVDNDNFFTVQAPSQTVFMPGDTAVYNLSLNNVAPGTYGGSLGFQAVDASGNAASGSASITATVTGQTPHVDSVTVAPGSVSLKKGGSAQFSATVRGSYLPTTDVTWMVDGATSAATAISGNGYLTVGSDEMASSLVVIAVSKADPGFSGTAGVVVKSEAVTHYVSVIAGEGGTVSGGGVVADGESVTIFASPSTGYSFYGWYDETGTFVSNKKKYTLNKVWTDVSLTAVFERGTAYIFTDVTPNGAGCASGDGSYPVGSSAVVKAEANDGYRFVGWKMNKKIVSKDKKFKLTNLDGEYRLVAVFEKNKYNVNVEVSPAGSGQVDGAAKYDGGKDALLKAYPTDGYRFKGWYSNCSLISSDPSLKIKNIKSDYCIQAVFEKKDAKAYVMASKAGAGGTITPAVTAPVPEGTNVTYVITPDRGYYISYLKVDGKDIGPAGTYVFNNVQANHTIEAVFAKIQETPASDSSASLKPQGSDGQTMADMKDDAQKMNEDEKAKAEAEAQVEEMNATTDLDTLTGVLQEYNMTPAEAYLHFDDEVGTAMFNQAIKEGYFEMVISNAFSDSSDRPADNIRTDSIDIPNWGVVAESFIADDEAIGALAGNKLTIHFDITNITGMEPEDDLAALMNAASQNNLAIGNTFDITFLKEYNGLTTNIKDLDVAAEFVLNIPDEIKADGRKFKILHVHDGQVEVLDNYSTDPNKVMFEANKLSTFAFAYETTDASQIGVVNATPEKLLVDTMNESPAKAKNGKTTTVVILVAVILLCSGLIATILIVNREPKKRRK